MKKLIALGILGTILMNPVRAIEQESPRTPPTTPKHEAVEGSQDDSLRTPKRAVKPRECPGAPTKKKPFMDPIPQQDTQELSARFETMQNIFNTMQNIFNDDVDM